eukprot:gb/GECH01000204.1/.p1 GENE.gb/GECH01000204.1/~~gb/GECH01000204.1/.p1  ORF type:complete len:155 (+),score=33.88 gb/GECH01000204.1/:1-465(+)
MSTSTTTENQQVKNSVKEKPKHETQEEIDQALNQLKNLFIAGFFFPPIWLYSRKWRNSRERHIIKKVERCETAFWISLLIFFVIISIIVIIVGTEEDYKQKDKDERHPILIGEYFAMIFSLLYCIVCGWDWVKTLKEMRDKRKSTVKNEDQNQI